MMERTGRIIRFQILRISDQSVLQLTQTISHTSPMLLTEQINAEMGFALPHTPEPLGYTTLLRRETIGVVSLPL